VTYSRFHLIFNVPLLIVLFFLSWQEPWTHDEVRAMFLVLIAVVVFTTPWDNNAAKRGIWGFPRDRYHSLLGHLPVEEYAFFILQSLNVMLGIRALFHFNHRWHLLIEIIPTGWTYACLAASLFAWIVIGQQLLVWRLRRTSSVNYMLHLVWFLPVIYLQWVLAEPLLGAHLGLLALATVLFGVYYTIADLIAVHQGIWFFDEKQITGFKFGRVLPWEEVAFFFLTSLLVAQSYLLLMPYYQR
jgi:lycopene cyclase domain-containing protein